MIGDVNLFISLAAEDDDKNVVVGELELMIADRHEQGKGYGRAALLAFLRYVVAHESEIVREFMNPQNAGDVPPSASSASQFDHFAVKIGQTNHRSISLFESLGFCKTTASPSYFGEYELRLARRSLVLDGTTLSLAGSGKSLDSALDGYREVGYVLPP